MRKRSKPVYVARAGNVRVPVYKYAGRATAAGKQVPARYCVAYRKVDGEPPKRETFGTRKAADERADEMAVSIHNGQANVLELTTADRDSWLLCVRGAEKMGMRPHMAIEELASIKEALGPVPPMEAVNSFLRAGSSKLTPKLSGRQVLDRLNLSLSEHPPKTMGEYRYRQGIRNDLAKFIAVHPRLEHVRAQQIREYLSGLHKEDGQRIGARRRDNIRDEIVQLFRFAKTRDGGEIFPLNEVTEAELVKRLKESTLITTYTPQELCLLLKFVSDRWLPWLATGAFSGARPHEILRFHWRFYKWHEKPEPKIAIPGMVANKTSKPRRAEFGPTLQRWLAPYRDAVGPIYKCSNLKEEMKLLEELTEETTRLGKLMSGALHRPWKWQRDALRHSYGSYRYAQVKDFGLISGWMGNSVAICRDRYFDSKSEEEAEAWYANTPDQVSNVIQGRFALGA